MIVRTRAGFDLNGRLPDAVLAQEISLRRPQRRRRIAVPVNAYMQGQPQLVRRDLGNLNVVHIPDQGGLGLQPTGKLGHVKVFRRALKKDEAGLAHQPNGGYADQRGDSNGQERIDLHPPGQHDHQRGGDRRDRAEKIAQHMQHRPAHIEVVFIGTMQDDKGDRVRRQTADGDPHHQRRVDLDRIGEPPHRLDHDPAEKNRQQDAVDESGEHLRPAITEMQPGVGGPRGEELRADGEPQSERVGEHVRRVREQGERAGDHAPDRFDDHEARDDGERPDQAPCRAARAVRVAVMMLAAAINHYARHSNSGLYMRKVDTVMKVICLGAQAQAHGTGSPGNFNFVYLQIKSIGWPKM